MSRPPAILVIDDSPDFFALARRFIQVEWPEAKVDGWDPPTRGQHDLLRTLPEYDVVLLDYMLGTDDGLTWLRYMKSDPACPPVILLTGHGSEAIAVEAMKLGASDYLRKHDLSRKQLVEAISACRAEAPRVPSTAQAKTKPQLIAKRQERSGAVHQIFIGGYTVVRKIGEGGMSSVYLAQRIEDGAQVVLKILDSELSKNDEFQRRFIRECGIISKISSAYVVRIFDQGFSTDHAYLAMEYFSGGDLKSRIDTGLTSHQALHILHQLALGLKAVHADGVVHRDLKPQNILFRANGTVGIVDFGIAKHVEEETQLTVHGQVFGTPYYMSPEQGLGKQLDARSDLYSLGVIFYEMLVGKRMYTADNAVSLVYKHIHDPIPKLPGKAADYQELLEHLAAKRPDERFDSAEALVNYLEALPGLKT